MRNLKDTPHIRVLCLALLLMGLIAVSACARQEDFGGKEGSVAEVEAITSGKLAGIGGKNAKTIYISIHDQTGKLVSLPSDAQGALAAQGLDLVDSPSKAAWILQVAVLGEGSIDLAALRKIVDEGYGHAAKFSGHGTTGLVADVLLVKRRVPTARRPSRERLTNIGRTNALGSSQMRVGLFVPHDTPKHSNLPDYFSITLTRELLSALKAGSKQMAEAN